MPQFALAVGACEREERRERVGGRKEGRDKDKRRETEISTNPGYKNRVTLLSERVN